MYYNTNELTGNQLKVAVVNNAGQAQNILRIMQDGQKRTPFEVQSEYTMIHKVIPITSVRRALTDLTKEGKLEKLSEMKNGVYGSPNHYWKIKE